MSLKTAIIVIMMVAAARAKRQTPNAAQFSVAADVVIVSFRKPDKNQFQNKTKKIWRQGFKAAFIIHH